LTINSGAATSLKHANPRDLPSYPSSGVKDNDSAAGAAASLGWANQKPFEHWKPDPSASASAAAMLAKDYKMKPLWQPEQSTNGAKAAVLAHKEGGKVEIWKPEATTWGNSAANLAFQTERKGNLSPQVDYGYTELGRKGSLLAATGAMSASRKRADSTPVAIKELYPDEANATTNALKAATSVHRVPSNITTKPSYESSGGATTAAVTTMSREMYTANPPVLPAEKNRADTLRASAVAMAQQMYKMQQKQIDDAANDTRGLGYSAATSAHGRRLSTSTTSGDVQPMRFNSLQEAAQKLAQERLAKIHNDQFEAREYRDYYSNAAPPSTNKLSRGRTRRRASSEGAKDEDRAQSQKIRAQMSLFSSNLSQVDQKKRQMDRENLIAIAQRNVRQSLHGMDEKLFQDTGRIAPSLLDDWEIKAQNAAQAKSDDRMQNHGKVNIGGGKFINQSEIDLVARNNVQPTLDEISEKAAIERARQDQIKHDQEIAKKEAEDKKARERETKEINKKLKCRCSEINKRTYSDILKLKTRRRRSCVKLRKRQQRRNKNALQRTKSASPLLEQRLHQLQPVLLLRLLTPRRRLSIQDHIRSA
jgi:hypothetical protein